MLTRTAMNKLRNIGFNQADFEAITDILNRAIDTVIADKTTDQPEAGRTVASRISRRERQVDSGRASRDLRRSAQRN